MGASCPLGLGDVGCHVNSRPTPRTVHGWNYLTRIGRKTFTTPGDTDSPSALHNSFLPCPKVHAYIRSFAAHLNGPQPQSPFFPFIMADKTDSSESTGPKLLQQAEKVLLQAINPDLMAYCPTMDLLAVATEEHNLEVYRINGQMAFRVARKNSKTKIDFACWKFNGEKKKKKKT